MLGLDAFFRKPRKFGYKPVFSDHGAGERGDAAAGEYRPGQLIRSGAMRRRNCAATTKRKGRGLTFRLILLLAVLSALIILLFL